MLLEMFRLKEITYRNFLGLKFKETSMRISLGNVSYKYLPTRAYRCEENKLH